MCVFHSGEILHELAETKITLQCPICGVVKNDFKKLLFHLKLLHEHTANFSVTCHVCSSLFTRVDSYRRHVYRKHDSIVVNSVRCDKHDGDDDADADESLVVITNDNVTSNSEMSIDILYSELRTHVNLLLLQLQEKHVLPHLVQETVACSVGFVIDYLWSNVSDIIKNMLTSLNLGVEENSDLYMLLENKDLFNQIFADASQHKLEKFSRYKLNLVDPTEIVLNTSSCSTLSSTSNCTFHYVSILETLRI